jgi:DeoR family transcriptional regulator, aga operon transcriptional repressor
MGIVPMQSTPTLDKKADRKTALIRLVQDSQPISVRDLANAAGLSQSTLRRELRQLADEGLVRVSVGQVALAVSSEEMPFTFRKMLNVEAKQRIAWAALELIRNGETVMIAGGTTTLELARLLPRQRRLTVITNSLRIAMLLADAPGIDLLILGGALRPMEQTLHGHLTEYGVHQFRADKLVYGVEAINLQHGVTHSQIVEVATDRAMANAATEVIVLADHTKFGRVAPAFVLSLEKIKVLITDQGLPEEIAQDLRSKDIRLILA